MLSSEADAYGMISRPEMMHTYDPERPEEAWHLLRKVFLLLLIVTASALGLVMLSRQRTTVPLVLFNILADASLGLLVGLGVRLALRGRNAFLQALTCAAVTLVGLGMLGYFTNWQSGVGPLSVGLVSVPWLDKWHVDLRLPLRFGPSGMDLLDLAHMVIAVDAAWLMLRVWKRSPQARSRASLPSPGSRRLARPSRATSAPIPPVTALRVPVIPRSNGGGFGRRKVGRPVAARPTATAIRPLRPKARRGNFMRRRPAVQLAVHEEHRCPYCLEPVNRNDPRGTVECQICHTLHHKDCWDITGNCQVPHLNS